MINIDVILAVTLMIYIFGFVQLSIEERSNETSPLDPIFYKNISFYKILMILSFTPSILVVSSLYILCAPFIYSGSLMKLKTIKHLYWKFIVFMNRPRFLIKKQGN
jgi:hypothetical protein